jgi:hypothetical protein
MYVRYAPLEQSEWRSGIGARDVELSTLLDGIVYRPRFFSAARGEFEISSRPLFELASGRDRSEREADR